MYRVSLVGLIVPFLLLCEVEGNVFGFLVFLPAVVLALVWIGVSLYAIFRNTNSGQEVDGAANSF